MTPDDNATKPRITFCSSVSEASGEDPAGSSWALRRMIFMEIPFPWPENVLQGRNAPAGLEELLWETYEKLPEPWGMIGIAPDPAYSGEGQSWIFDLQQPEGIAGTYHRDSYLVPSEQMVRYLRLLSYEPHHPDLDAVRQPDDQSTRDFLVCTHGTVDACCATMGYPMYKLMRAMADQAKSPVRVWRCTHFGGHRFAATALEAPTGRYWGRLKANMLADLVHQRVPARDLRPYYRGWAALPEPLWQIAEAEILVQAGWGWSNAIVTSIAGTVTPEDGGRITIAFTHPDAPDASVDIEITPSGTLQTMDSTNDAQLRDAPQYTARILRQRPENCLDLS